MTDDAQEREAAGFPASLRSPSGPNGRTTALSYMPQLDSLRALAAIGVFAQHFLPDESLFVSTVPLGDLGVRMFFVLSGFLITLILLESRDRVSSGAISRKAVLTTFFSRRFLRLIPVYFFAITVMFALNPQFIRYAGWFYTYLQNIHYAIQGEFTLADHLWTLAVEEQFYLLWPFLILLVPSRWMLETLAGVVVLGLASRTVFVLAGMTHFSASMLMPSHLDTLGTGALMAAWIKRWGFGRTTRRYLNVGLAVAIALLGAVLVSKVLGLTSMIEFLLGEIGAGLLFAWVIGHASVGFRGPTGALLRQPFLIYLGKISYGMYVYHWFVPGMVEMVATWTGFAPPGRGWTQFALFTVISIAIAALSWHVMERPILRLKKRFSYRAELATPS